MLMNWEQTDRVRAETANDSSSESALGDSIRFPPPGRRVELLFWLPQVGSSLRSRLQTKASGMARRPLAPTRRGVVGPVL